MCIILCMCISFYVCVFIYTGVSLRSHQHFEHQILTKKKEKEKIVCALSLEPNGGFWPNFMYCIIGIIKRID